MTTTVVVPTYRRPKDLYRCLRALESLVRRPDQVVIVVHESDTQTCDLLCQMTFGLNIETVTVRPPGLVGALNAGLQVAQGDVIAITDDDAAPRPDWLTRIVSHYLRDRRIGGVGGRDLIHGREVSGGEGRRTVGQVQWFGRVVGNHHRGIGPVREVDVLKGVNMSYRRPAIQSLTFDERLRGTGAQVCNDMAMSLRVQRRGWKLIYDPQIVVSHYPAERFDRDRRNAPSFDAIADAVHNETLTLLEYLPPLRQLAFLSWSIAVGTEAAPGLAQLVRLFPRQPRLAVERFVATLRGRCEGFDSWRKAKACSSASMASNQTAALQLLTTRIGGSER